MLLLSREQDKRLRQGLQKKEAKKQGMDATRNGKNKRPKFVNSGAFE